MQGGGGGVHGAPSAHARSLAAAAAAAAGAVAKDIETVRDMARDGEGRDQTPTGAAEAVLKERGP